MGSLQVLACRQGLAGSSGLPPTRTRQRHRVSAPLTFAHQWGQKTAVRFYLGPSAFGRSRASVCVIHIHSSILKAMALPFCITRA